MPAISLRIAGKVFIVFKGLSILNALSGLSETEEIGKSSKIPKMTTMKSIQFH